jgi:uncharacterized protein
MIHVEINRQSDNRITSFSYSGHAHYAPSGEDIVCAAISAVAIGTINAVHALLDVELSVETDQPAGLLSCKVPDIKDREIDEKVQLLLESMVVSVQSIAEQYTEYVTLNIKGGG